LSAQDSAGRLKPSAAGSAPIERLRARALALPAALDRPRVQFVALAIIVAIAAFLRFYKLGAWSFWGDEMLTIIDVPDGFNYELLRRSLMLSTILAVIGELGVSEWSARLAPALVGVLSVPVLYFPVRRMLGPAVALLFALLLAVSPWHLYWSQNARYYILLLLFYTLALLFLYFGLHERRISFSLLGLLFLALATRERLLALFLVPVIGSYMVITAALPGSSAGIRRFSARSLLLLLGLLLVALLFALPYLRDLRGWLVGFGAANNTPLWLGAGVLYYLRLPVVVLAIVGAVALFARERHAAILLSLSAVVPLLVLMIISSFHYTANRYAFVSLTSWLILAAAGTHALIRQTTRTKMWPALAIVMLALVDPLSEDAFYFTFNNGNRDDWKSAFALVQERREPGERVISNHEPIASYYMGEPTVHLAHITVPEDITAGEEAVWIVQDMTMAMEHPAQTAWVERNAQLVAVLDNHLYGRNYLMRVYYYDPAVGGEER